MDLPDRLEGHVEPEDTNDNPISRDLAVSWATQCWAKHKTCSKPAAAEPWIPRRLLQIDAPALAGTTVRVVDRDEIEGKIAYIALSHRWGDSSVLTLNISTRTELKVGIALDRLPTTFRDAIRVCKWFDLRYLWIDSLCIVQDSPDDWLRESHTMKAVYNNAFLTIAAGTGASDAGLFVHRRPSAVKVPQVETSWHALPNQRYCIVDDRLWMRDVDNAPLSKRAWVVQERFLSPRVLFFGATQMFYECCEKSVCETFPGGRARCELGWEPKRLDHINTTAMKAWYAASKAYSAASLTKYSDKIIAIAGVAEMCQERLDDQYVVGLWRKAIIAQLCWETHARDYTRPDPCVAPTWSWLSINGSLRLDALFEACGPPFLRILKIHVDLIDKDAPTGQIRSAFLRVRCQLKPASWHQVTQYGRMDFRRYQLSCDGIDYSGYGGDHDADRRFFTNVDIIPTPDILDAPVFIMPVTRVKYKGRLEQVLALVLKRQSKDANTFERIGRVSIGPTVAAKLFMQRQAELETFSGMLEGVLQFFALNDPTWTRIPSQEITLV